MNKKLKYTIYIIIIILLIIIPLLSYNNAFVGSDDQGMQLINKIDNNYKPWYDNIFKISDDMESIFFTLQACLGGIALGYFLGRIHSAKTKV